MTKKREKFVEMEERKGEYQRKEARRLYLSQDDKVVAGVCGGIAEYLDVDSIWVRLVFIIAAINGIGIIAYILFWVLLPDNPYQKHYTTVAEEKVEEFSSKLKKEGRKVKREMNEKKHYEKEVHKHRRKNDHGGLIFGAILIVLGSMFLFEKFFWTINWDYVWPSLLILLGFYFIFKRD